MTPDDLPKTPRRNEWWVPAGGWHQRAGQTLVPAGLIAAVSGLWLTQFYPPVHNDGDLLYVIRLAAGSAMALFIVSGITALWRRDFAKHGAWMLRAYAIGLGAGTQAFTHIPWILFFGAPNELARALLMATGWAINLVVAEWIVRGRPRMGELWQATDGARPRAWRLDSR